MPLDDIFNLPEASNSYSGLPEASERHFAVPEASETSLKSFVTARCL